MDIQFASMFIELHCSELSSGLQALISHSVQEMHLPVKQGGQEMVFPI